MKKSKRNTPYGYHTEYRFAGWRGRKPYYSRELVANSLLGTFGDRYGGPVKHVTVASRRSSKQDVRPRAYQARGGTAGKRIITYIPAPGQSHSPPNEHVLDVLNDVPVGNGYVYMSYSKRAEIYNSAVRTVRDRLESSNSFFEDWYERHQAYDMIGSAIGKIGEFIKFAKNPKSYLKRKSRRRFIRKTFNLKNGHIRKTFESVPDAWLAYNFGIKPLIGTVERGMELMSREVSPVWHYGTASGSEKVDFETAEQRITGTVTRKVKIGVEVRGFNPNRRLAQKLGLDKPLTNIWSVVPWGWAIDYFVNVSEFLSNYEPKTTGLIIGSSFTTVFDTFSGKEDVQERLIKPGGFTQNSVPMYGWSMTRSPSASLDYMLELVNHSNSSYSSLGSKVANLVSILVINMKGLK